MGKTAVGLMYHLYAGVFLSKFIQNTSCRIRGTVIHHDNFQIGICLFADRADTSFNISLYIVGGNDYGNQFRLLFLIQFWRLITL